MPKPRKKVKHSLKWHVQKEALEHPELVRKYGIDIAVQIAKDHLKLKQVQLTTTKDGKNTYMADYMRRQRFLQKNPNASPIDISNAIFSGAFKKTTRRKTK